jgi:hypothetical protein
MRNASLVVASFCALFGAFGCAAAAPNPTAPPAPTSIAMTTTPLYCELAGIGVAPDPPPPTMETHFAIVVFEADNPGPPARGVTVEDLALLDEAGHTLGLRRIQSVEILSLREPAPPLNAPGSAAYYSNGPDLPIHATVVGPFDGTLDTGRTRIRVRASLAGSPSVLSTPSIRSRVTLKGLDQPLVIEGGACGASAT